MNGTWDWASTEFSIRYTTPFTPKPFSDDYKDGGGISNKEHQGGSSYRLSSGADMVYIKEEKNQGSRWGSWSKSTYHGEEVARCKEEGHQFWLWAPSWRKWQLSWKTELEFSQQRGRESREPACAGAYGRDSQWCVCANWRLFSVERE